MSELHNPDNRRDGSEEMKSSTGSRNSASEGPDDSSSESWQTSNPEHTQKRKILNQEVPWSRLKRFKAAYSDGYRKMFNETVNEIVKGMPVDEEHLLQPSQNGITMWSSYEKEIFFMTVAKRGKDDLPGIAAAICTKSELEVNAYIQLLQKATIDEHLQSPSSQLFEISEIPGAFEVSQNCCAALDLCADSLSVLQQKEEEKLERRKYNKLWLLKKRTVPWVSKRQSEQNGRMEILERLPAAELLNLGSFLRLSSHIFMNSSLWEENWRCYRTRNEFPSIYYTAFADFHRLAISITKRLIQSSLFFAMSRIKATSSSYYRQEKSVRRRDISAALNTLGMEHSSQSFWAGAARRCNLVVYDNTEGQNSKDKNLSHDEVENRLGRGYYEGRKIVEDGLEIYEATEIPQSDHDSEYSQFDNASSSSSTSTASKDSISHSLSSQDEKHSSKQETLEEAQDAYAQALDNRASQDEELRLWALLGKDLPEPISLEEPVLPRRPAAERKTGDDLDDWRSWVAYAPEWETCEVPLPARGFGRRRRPGRRGSIHSLSTSTRDDSNEESRGGCENHGDYDRSSLGSSQANSTDEDFDDQEEEQTSTSEGSESSGDEMDVAAP